MIRLPFGLNKSILEIARPGVCMVGWMDIAETTIKNRNGLDGFLRDGAAEEMAQAGERTIANGGTLCQAIDAVEAAYHRNCIYSTPHEHPCDEWHPIDILRLAA